MRKIIFYTNLPTVPSLYLIAFSLDMQSPLLACLNRNALVFHWIFSIQTPFRWLLMCNSFVMSRIIVTFSFQTTINHTSHAIIVRMGRQLSLSLSFSHTRYRIQRRTCTRVLVPFSICCCWCCCCASTTPHNLIQKSHKVFIIHTLHHQNVICFLSLSFCVSRMNADR